MENNHCRGREGGREGKRERGREGGKERERINQDQKRGQGINTSRVYSAQRSSPRAE